MPERAYHVHKDARALTFNCRRVRTLDEREDLLQSSRLGILAIRR